MKKCIYAHWNVLEYDGDFYINRTHNIYLEHLIESSDIQVLCNIRQVKEKPSALALVAKEVEFINLPSKGSYVSAYIHITNYFVFFKELFNENNYDMVYVRCPDPIAWLVIMRASKHTRVTAHFVGDSLDATWKSDSNFLIKIIKSLLYLPDYFLLMVSCKFYANKIYTNGPHIMNKLNFYRVKAEAVVSSTMSSLDGIHQDAIIESDSKITKLLYVGYLRPSKGVFNLIESINELSKKTQGITLTIVGDGESRSEIEKLIIKKGLQNRVFLTGHIDSKEQLENIYRSHDVFCFPSQSEGSPRVVIEAMYFGLLVVSNKVGSLPYSFDNNEVIFTSNYSADAFLNSLLKAVSLSKRDRITMRLAALNRVKNYYSKESFLNKVFA